MIKKYCILTKNNDGKFKKMEKFNTLEETLYHVYKYLKYKCSKDFDNSFFKYLNIDYNRVNLTHTIYEYLKHECRNNFEDVFLHNVNEDFSKENSDYNLIDFENIGFLNYTDILVMSYLLLEYMNHNKFDKEQLESKKKEIISKCIDCSHFTAWSPLSSKISINDKRPRKYGDILNEMKEEMLKFVNQNSPNYIIGSFYEKE